MLAIAGPLAMEAGRCTKYQKFRSGLSLKREIITFKGLRLLFSPVNFSMLGS
jgi:hypothetical protein